MNSGPSKEDLLWMLSGAVVLALLLLVVWRFRQDPTEQLASKASRVEMVGRMQVGLESASEAEKSAVLASTDEDSQAFADQARAASAGLERERQELARLLASDGTPAERELLSRFSEAFANLQRIDDELLRLAVKNTNLKAYGLLYGPAAEAAGELDAALGRLVAKVAGSPDALRATVLASSARIGVLRIQALLAPHIAEATSAKMDQLEAAMKREADQVERDLAGLAKLPALREEANLAAAAFARYGQLESRILALSRENTNVQSLALSLNEKRRAMVLCLEALEAVKQAILEEPVVGLAYTRLPTR